MSKTKALVLFSGGLDSMLATKLLLDQNIECLALCFSSNFYGADKAFASAQKINVPLRVVSLRQEMLELVKNPPSGYGKNMNPCLDCHALMIRQAGEILKKENYDFLASGEVLGQRPFSQTKEALVRVQKLAGIEILRPLSAKLLPETEAEKKGLVIRGKLLRISGRGREEQMEKMAKMGQKDYPTPAGGCLLTDPTFSERLVKILDYWPFCDKFDIELLKHGRIFWFKHLKKKEAILAVIGRNFEDNEKLAQLTKKGDVIIKIKNENGPTALIRKLFKTDDMEKSQDFEYYIDKDLKLSSFGFNEKKNDQEIIDIISTLTGWYQTKMRGKNVIINVEKL